MATAPTVPPPDGTPVPPGASQAFPETFDEDADAAFAAQRPFQLEMQALKANVHANAQGAYANTLEVAANTTLAQNMADIATSLANFKGAWPSLSGPLPKPASALHNSAYWVLLNDLVNVATSEPGVSGDWSEAGVTSVNGMRGVVVIESSVADVLFLNQLYGAF